MSRSSLAALLATTAIAALAAAPAAADPVQVVDASEEDRCAAVTSSPSGGCQFQAEGTLSLLSHTGMAEVTLVSCSVAADFYVDGDGAGYADAVELTGSETCASIDQCDDAPWAFATEAVGDGTFDVTVASCLEHPLGGECAGGYGLTLNEGQDELEAAEAALGACEATADLAIENPEAFAVVAPARISTTGPPNAVSLYDGDLNLTNVSDFTIAGYTCNNVWLRAEIESSPGGSSYIDGFVAGQFDGCGAGSIVLLDLSTVWYGFFKLEDMKTLVRGARVRIQYGGGIGNCDYAGTLKGMVVNIDDPAPTSMRVFFSNLWNNIPKYAGGGSCPATISIHGTFQALRTPGGGNVWLR